MKYSDYTYENVAKEFFQCDSVKLMKHKEFPTIVWFFVSKKDENYLLSLYTKDLLSAESFVKALKTQFVIQKNQIN